MLISTLGPATDVSGRYTVSPIWTAETHRPSRYRTSSSSRTLSKCCGSRDRSTNREPSRSAEHANRGRVETVEFATFGADLIGLNSSSDHSRRLKAAIGHGDVRAQWIDEHAGDLHPYSVIQAGELQFLVATTNTHLLLSFSMQRMALTRQVCAQRPRGCLRPMP